jgi:GNAT superfamily N-acetyltransferase
MVPRPSKIKGQHWRHKTDVESLFLTFDLEGPSRAVIGDPVNVTSSSRARRALLLRCARHPDSSLTRQNVGVEAAITIVPANEASWEDLQTVFGPRGPAPRCQCQRYKLRPRESFGSFPAEERADRLRRTTDSGHPESDTTSGLVAYLDGQPAGWCAVEPRPAYTGLLRQHFRVPWEGRSEDRTDDTVWAVTCFVVRAGFRKRGVGRALARATVAFARDRGARAIEGYPIVTKQVLPEELHVGTVAMFAAAGFTEVSRPTLRRAVMRIDF